MLRRIFTVGGYTLLSRLTGFARDIMLAAILGAGPAADAFFIALRLPNHFRAIFAEGAFNAAFVPAYSHVNGEQGDAAARLFANRIFTLLFLSQVVLLIVAWIFMPQAMSILAPGFSDDAEQSRLAIELTRITFPYLLLITLVTLYGGMLNVMHRFASAAAAPIFLNLSMIMTLALAAYFPTAGHAAAWGVLISGFLQFFLLAGDLGRAWRTAALLRGLQLDEDVKAFFRALGPATLGSMGTQVALFADTIIATFLPAGALSALYYADRLNQLPIGVIGIAIGTVLLPEMSRRLTAGDHAGATASQRRAFDFTLAVFGAVRGRLSDRARCDHARHVRARRLFEGRRGGCRRDTCSLCGGPHSLCADPQRGRDVLCAQEYRDAGKGRADGCRGQCRAEGRADGFARADRSRACHGGRGLDQSSACDRLCGSGRVFRARPFVSDLAGKIPGRRCRARGSAVVRRALRIDAICELEHVAGRGSARVAYYCRRGCLCRAQFC